MKKIGLYVLCASAALFCFSMMSFGNNGKEELTDPLGCSKDNGAGGNTSTDLNHEAVDLGLSVKWATCNVGASSPEEYGGYYAWGETEEKSNYDWSTYKHCKGTSETRTKYCTNSSYGFVDNKTVLEPEDDVAHVKWGGSWRMPTSEEIDELVNNCSWIWTARNGVKGYVVTSNATGSSIFLPATGCRFDEIIDYCGSDGNYWSASLKESYNAHASNLLFSRFFRGGVNDGRNRGFSVRPVTD